MALRTALWAPSQPTTNAARTVVRSPRWSSVASTYAFSSSWRAETKVVSYSTWPPFLFSSSARIFSVTSCGTMATKGYGVCSGWNGICASVCPWVITATHVTLFAASKNGCTTPAMSKISSVRGKIASAGCGAHTHWPETDPPGQRPRSKYQYQDLLLPPRVLLFSFYLILLYLLFLGNNLFHDL